MTVSKELKRLGLVVFNNKTKKITLVADGYEAMLTMYCMANLKKSERAYIYDLDTLEALAILRPFGVGTPKEAVESGLILSFLDR